MSIKINFRMQFIMAHHLAEMKYKITTLSADN